MSLIGWGNEKLVAFGTGKESAGKIMRAADKRYMAQRATLIPAHRQGVMSTDYVDRLLSSRTITDLYYYHPETMVLFRIYHHKQEGKLGGPGRVA